MITSWYVSNIPVINLNENEKKSLWKIALNVINYTLNQNEAIKKIDNIIFKNLQFPKKDYEKIIYFSKNLWALV